LPNEAIERYARALLGAKDRVRAQAVVDRAFSEDPLPVWAIAVAAQLALYRADPAKAAQHLAALDERGDLAVDGRIRLVLCLLQTGNAGATAKHLDTLRKESGGLTAVQLMEVAELLRMAGRAEEAIPIAFRAARLAPADPAIQRAFAGLVLTSGVSLAEPDVVGPDTHVVLRNAA